MIAPKPSNSVFVNCPFDRSYKQIFNAILFCIFDAGFVPRCALEIEDSTQSRLAKILDLIGQCNFAIHDISYTDIDSGTHLPRFNMPFELGLYFGCHKFSGDKKKACLILDREAYSTATSYRTSPDRIFMRMTATRAQRSKRSATGFVRDRASAIFRVARIGGATRDFRLSCQHCARARGYSLKN